MIAFLGEETTCIVQRHCGKKDATGPGTDMGGGGGWKERLESK